MDSDTRWCMSWLSAGVFAIGFGIWQNSPAAGFLCAGFMGFSLIGISMGWREIKQIFSALGRES